MKDKLYRILMAGTIFILIILLAKITANPPQMPCDDVPKVPCPPCECNYEGKIITMGTIPMTTTTLCRAWHTDYITDEVTCLK